MVMRLLALLCALALFLPMAASAAEFRAIFPAGSNFAADILTTSSLDGVHHQHLGVNLVNLDLFAVTMIASGAPDALVLAPWVYGKISKVEQLNANTFRVTWTVSTSANGVNFFPGVGTVVITFTL